MKREASELRWRIKLTVAAAGVGGWLGGWSGAAWLAWRAGGWTGWGVFEWLKWAHALYQLGWGWALAAAAAAGAATAATLAGYVMFRSGAKSSRPRPALY